MTKLTAYETSLVMDAVFTAIERLDNYDRDGKLTPHGRGQSDTLRSAYAKLQQAEVVIDAREDGHVAKPAYAIRWDIDHACGTFPERYATHAEAVHAMDAIWDENIRDGVWDEATCGIEVIEVAQ